MQMTKTNEPKALYFLITMIQFKGFDITVLYYHLYFYGVRSKPRNSVSRDRRNPRTYCMSKIFKKQLSLIRKPSKPTLPGKKQMRKVNVSKVNLK